jgi:nucleoside-diphosphate-sugar epimerase
MQTILGANGTIGQVLAAELIRYTSRIRLVSRTPKKVNATDELFPADLSIPGMVDKAIAGSDVAYLLVGLDYNTRVWQKKWPPLMRETLDACIRHRCKLVFFDNVYLYDQRALPHMTEDSPVNPPSKKGKVRKEIADMLMSEVRAGKLTALIARAADFYGPQNEKSFLIEMVYKNIHKGKRPMWFVDADKKHSFTYTPDAARAVAILGNNEDTWNQVWHVPTDRHALTGRQMAGLFMKEMHAQSQVSTLPRWMVKALGLFVPVMREMPEMLYQFDRDYVFDSTKFEKRFGIQPTAYEEGVRKIVAGDPSIREHQ